MRGLAEIAERFGSGTIRLTVWQNLLISDVADRDVGICIAAIDALGLGIEASAIRARPGRLHRQCRLQVRRRPTPRAMRCGSPTISRRAWRSTCRSTSTSPAATIPAPSTISATSACWPPRSIAARTASRAITSISAAAPPRPPSRRWRASMPSRWRSTTCRRCSSACSRAWLAHRAAPTESFFEFTPPPRGRRPARSRRPRACGARGMNAITPVPSIIPENAPFSTEQRAWLNGFFAAYLGVSGEAAGHDRRRCRAGRGLPLARRVAGDARAAGARQGRQARAPAHGRHGPARLRPVRLSLPDLRRGRVVGRRGRHGPLRAGRQGDPAQAEGAFGRAGTAARRRAGGSALRRPAAPVGSRDRPALATLVDAYPLNRPGSGKDVRHVVLDLSATDLTYEAGDSVGVFARKNPQLVQAVLDRARRHRRGDGGLRRRRPAVAPGPFEQGRHRPAQRRLPDVPGRPAPSTARRR